MNTIIYTVLLLVGILQLSSCTCPVESVEVTTSAPKNATISRFSPVQGANDESIHSFLFFLTGTGALVDDQRYASSAAVRGIVDQASFTTASGEQRIARQIMTDPANKVMAGDILVVDVNPVPGAKTATLRFAGSLAPLGVGFISENPTSLINTVRSRFTTCADLDGKSSKQGEILLPPIAVVGTAGSTIEVVDLAGNRTTDPIPADITTRFSKNLRVVDVTVRLGDLFYYRAIHGGAYAIHISAINEGETDASAADRKRKVSIDFVQLCGPECEM